MLYRGLRNLKKWRATLSFWWGRHGNRLATSCKFTTPFCLGRVLVLGELIVLYWLCDLQALEIQNQGFNYKMTSISLRLIHKALGLKGLVGKEYCFGSRSSVLYVRLAVRLYDVWWGKTAVFSLSTWPWIYYRTHHSLWAFPEDNLISGFIGDLVQGLILNGSLLRSQAFSNPPSYLFPPRTCCITSAAYHRGQHIKQAHWDLVPVSLCVTVPPSTLSHSEP